MSEARLAAIGPSPSSGEPAARRALAAYYSAMNWLEDTPDFEAAHIKLHEAGRWVMANFDCWYVLTDRGYEQQCPVSLAHLRFGFSPEMVVGPVLCSVCREDATECPHIIGRTYELSCTKDVTGECNVCGEQACAHVAGEMYSATCQRIITEIKRVDGVAMVARPAQPDARILGRPVDVAGLRERQPPGWEPGGPARCTHCRVFCEGFKEMAAGH